MLPEGNLGDAEDINKYLGIPQANENHEETAMKAATVKYLQRERQVLRGRLNGKNKVRAIKPYAGPQIPCWYNNLAKRQDRGH